MSRVVYFAFFMCCTLGDVCAQPTQVLQEAPVGAPVEVYGRANLGNGQSDSVLLRQQGDENPLGNPIVLPPLSQSNAGEKQNVFSIESSMVAPSNAPQNVIQENLPQNPKISPQESPQIVNKQIQNTLYESGGRIYDIQSYPDTDVSYVEKPNFSNAVTTYPAY